MVIYDIKINKKNDPKKKEKKEDAMC